MWLDPLLADWTLPPMAWPKQTMWASRTSPPKENNTTCQPHQRLMRTCTRKCKGVSLYCPEHEFNYVGPPTIWAMYVSLLMLRNAAPNTHDILALTLNLHQPPCVLAFLCLQCVGGQQLASRTTTGEALNATITNDATNAATAKATVRATAEVSARIMNATVATGVDAKTTTTAKYHDRKAAKPTGKSTV
jgi:hypothetical protein